MQMLFLLFFFHESQNEQKQMFLIQNLHWSYLYGRWRATVACSMVIDLPVGAHFGANAWLATCHVL